MRTPPSIAREGNQEMTTAVWTSGPGERIGKDAALEVTPGLAFHIGRHALPVAAGLGRHPSGGRADLRVGRFLY